VVVASDQSLYETEVFTASYSQPPGPDQKSKQLASRRDKVKKKEKLPWGDKPVLVLIGVKLGIEGVNPVYYECIKVSGRCCCKS
jgi:cysteine protease ATG4